MTKASNIETKVTMSLIFLDRIFAWFLSQKIQKGKGKNPKIQENYKSYGLSKKVFIKFEMTIVQMISSFLSEVKQARKKINFSKHNFNAEHDFF